MDDNKPTNKKLKICKHCGAEMAKSAKICPNCGGKNPKPIYKRVWFWILAIIVVFGLVGSLGGNSSAPSPDTTADTTAEVSEDTTTEAEEATEETVTIEYGEVTTDELSDALEENPMNASDTYKGQYYAVTGRLSNIDSDGKYIALVDINDEWSFNVITCYIKDDEQKEKVKQMKIDDTVTVRGQITDVGEVLGYYLDIDSID